MKHTPEPWHIEKYDNSDKEIVIPEPGIRINNDDVDHLEAAANALLVLAAPRLLAALRPFANLALVLKEGQYLNYLGVYISYDDAIAALDAVAMAPSNV